MIPLLVLPTFLLEIPISLLDVSDLLWMFMQLNYGFKKSGKYEFFKYYSGHTMTFSWEFILTLN